ncbi:12568_t:CDS:2 [Racocetra fulgida]|uniref:12568_t:CDS:1 n=1 Tax=Racocetra fulgida TaxID=60492 RepID=A0A9N9A3X3_9GLOM|nr:12568_t:CDS:2 [Racocetra fulgida]
MLSSSPGEFQSCEELLTYIRTFAKNVKIISPWNNIGLNS